MSRPIIIGLSSMILCVLLLWLSMPDRKRAVARPAAEISSLDLPRGPSSRQISSYQLPPAKFGRSRSLYLIASVLFLLAEATSLGSLFSVLQLRYGVALRNWAEGSFGSQLQQAFAVVAIIGMTISILQLPLVAYWHSVQLMYGQSFVSWRTWILGWAAQNILIWGILAPPLMWILRKTIRHSPRHWWLYFWMVFTPISTLAYYIRLNVLDPVVREYTPLRTENPELAEQVLNLEHRAGLNVPSNRIYASQDNSAGKPNLYIIGFSSSARIVVSNAALAKLTTNQLLFLFGHEFGHYALRHIFRMLALVMTIDLLMFYVAYRLAGALLHHWGSNWELSMLDDWAAIPLLLLAFFVVSMIAMPVLNGYSRYQERQADQFSLELLHNVVPDSKQVAAQTFQFLGEDSLEYPCPSRLFVTWSWDHPPMSDRIRFALTYDPWSQGKPPEFVKAQVILPSNGRKRGWQ